MCFIHSRVSGYLSFINPVGQKEELNFGLGESDQVNGAQSTVQRIKDKVSLLVQRSDMPPYWGRALCNVCHAKKKKVASRE